MFPMQVTLSISNQSDLDKFAEFVKNLKKSEDFCKDSTKVEDFCSNSKDSEENPWILNPGYQPVENSVFVDVKWYDGVTVKMHPAGHWCWEDTFDYYRISK